MTAHDPDELLTITEVADRLGVTRNNIYVWRARGLMPPPDRALRGGSLLWRWATIAGANLPPRRNRAIGRPQA